MASITKYKTKAGELRYRVQYRTPENKLTGARGFKTKREAENYAATVTVSKARGEYIDPADARVTVGDLGPDWLARRTHLKPSSRRVEEVAWRVHVEPKWGAVKLANLRHSAVQSWVSAMGRAVTDAEGNANTQIAQIQSMIDADVDVIVVIAGSSTALNRVIEQACAPCARRSSKPVAWA